jgi:multidrug resistance efflux pump
MANLELLTLAKALSVKDRLAGRLAQARENIETYNSVLAGQRDDYGKATADVRAEYDRYRKLQDGWIVVKATIQRALASHQACDEWPLAD